MTASATPTDALFAAPGEMGRLCREKDWAATPLGPPEGWPQSLRTVVTAVLGSAFPSIVLWGPQLVQIYNDGYAMVMGAKHPWGLGLPTRECWPEAQEFTEPIYARVLAGETVSLTDQLYRLRRGGPQSPLEDVYISISYGPVREESGAVGGIFVTLFDTTSQVRERELQTEREQLMEELRRERERLENVFQHAPSFLAVLRGTDHVFTHVNEAYYQIVGHRDTVGKPLLEAVPEVAEQGFVEIMDGVLATGKPFVGTELPAEVSPTPGAPTETRYINITYLPLTEGEGTRVGVIAHGTDVTEQVLARREVERLLAGSEEARGEMERTNAQLSEQQVELELITEQLQENAAELEAQAEALAEANQAKSDFLANMSHELRTPLNAIGGYTELMELGIHGPVTEAQRDTLARVQTAQRHLLTLINDILSYARLEAGRVEFDLTTLDAHEVLSTQDALIAPQARAKSIAYGVGECDQALHFTGDAERVRQVLLNLVGNAVKFTEPGGRVTLRCDADAEWVYLRVEDDGRGIPAEKLDAIFDPFTQVDRRLDQPQGGVGLGLAISRDLARGMGGDLSAESAPGRGSVFTLRLPRAG